MPHEVTIVVPGRRLTPVQIATALTGARVDIVSFSNRMISHDDIVMVVTKRSGLPVSVPSPQNSSSPRIATIASFPNLEMTATLTLPV